jgi:hypothetical protein
MPGKTLLTRPEMHGIRGHGKWNLGSLAWLQTLVTIF